MDWRQTVGQARQEHREKKISDEKIVQIEEETLQQLCQAIRKEFSPADDDSEFFYLSKVIKNKKAQFLGYAQLLYLLGTPLGLTVKVTDVLEPATGYLPPGKEHAVCLVELDGGKTIIVDLAAKTQSKPFVFKDQYRAAGNYWEFSQRIIH